MGSCFAQELRAWLKKHGYNCLPQEWGVIYSPQSIAQIIKYSLESETWKPTETFWEYTGKFHDPYIKAKNHSGPVVHGESLEEARKAQKRHYDRSSSLLKEADAVVWTLGVTELWRNKEDHSAFFEIPSPDFFDPDLHEFYNLTYEDVLECLEYSIETLIKYNPTVKILLSVSPIPLHVTFRDHLGPLVATQYSKSILHAAALTVFEKYDAVLYMPSYEITRIDPVSNYMPDGRHVNERCINSIMKVFKGLYVLE